MLRDSIWIVVSVLLIACYVRKQLRCCVQSSVLVLSTYVFEAKERSHVEYVRIRKLYR